MDLTFSISKGKTKKIVKWCKLPLILSLNLFSCFYYPECYVKLVSASNGWTRSWRPKQKTNPRRTQGHICNISFLNVLFIVVYMTGLQAECIPAMSVTQENKMRDISREVTAWRICTITKGVQQAANTNSTVKTILAVFVSRWKFLSTSRPLFQRCICFLWERTLRNTRK